MRLAEQPGGRWGQVLVLAGFLLCAPPMFLFGPLAALLLVSRPATVREWVWLLGALGWSALWLQQAGGLGAQFARAAAVLVSGCFLALTLWRPSNRMCRALTAVTKSGAMDEVAATSVAAAVAARSALWGHFWHT